MKQLAFIWDMDGTLVDSYPAIVPAAGETLAAFGAELGALSAPCWSASPGSGAWTKAP